MSEATPTSTDTLAPVGKTMYIECKKCGTDRYFVVLAHKTATSAKVKCEVCGAQRSYTLPKAQARKTGTSTRASKSAAAARDNHTKEYEKLMQENDANPAQTYNMKMKFEVNQKVSHPKFGVGLVRAAQPEKIEVVFQDEVRNLVHNRQ
jgi:predicted Zn finger-like uncharacterized protein